MVLATVLVLTALGAGAPAGAQQPAPQPNDCAASRPIDVVFVGRVTAIADDLVTFSVRDVRSGDIDGDSLAVRYPSRYNARELEVGEDYLVPLVDVVTGASATATEPRSFVDTAELGTCGSNGTRLPDGSPIDTGTLAGVGPTVVRYGAWAAALVAGVLVLLVLFGRFLDRRSRYRKPVRL